MYKQPTPSGVTMYKQPTPSWVTRHKPPLKLPLQGFQGTNRPPSSFFQKNVCKIVRGSLFLPNCKGMSNNLSDISYKKKFFFGGGSSFAPCSPLGFFPLDEDIHLPLMLLEHVFQDDGALSTNRSMRETMNET